MGGAVAVLESSILVTNCLFRSNVAQVSKNGGNPTDGSAGGGGDVYLRNGTLSAFDSRFKNSVAGFPVSPRIDMESKEFTGDGGSMLIHGGIDCNQLLLSDCVYSNTAAYGNGGAISLSRDSSSTGRSFFSMWDIPNFHHPFALSGGCDGVISNCSFLACRGGWQGGAISVNGAEMLVDIVQSSFVNCVGGHIYLKDGKGGGLALGGGIQSSYIPECRTFLADCEFRECEASGNGGGLYVTIRGCAILVGCLVKRCKALNLGTALSESDYSTIEGMGGGIHVSAGGMVFLQGFGSHTNVIASNAASSNGGGISIKSGRVYFEGTNVLTGNIARGDHSTDHGNGGGLFVTTSGQDDFFGAGHGAAMVYSENGHAEVLSGPLSIINNSAAGWGGGIYAGLVHPLNESDFLTFSTCPGVVVVSNTYLENNTASKACVEDQCLFPSQMAFERFGNGFGPFRIENCFLSGDSIRDVGIYLLETTVPFTNNVTYSSLGRLLLRENR